MAGEGLFAWKKKRAAFITPRVLHHPIARNCGYGLAGAVVVELDESVVVLDESAPFL
jgi:hypothetical protein